MDVSPSAWRPFPGLSDVTSAKTAQNRMCSAHPKKKCLRPGSAWKIAWDSLGSERGKTAPFARIAFACRRGRTLDPPGRSGEGPGRQQHLLLPQRAWRDKPTAHTMLPSHWRYTLLHTGVTLWGAAPRPGRPIEGCARAVQREAIGTSRRVTLCAGPHGERAAASLARPKQPRDT